MTHEYEQPSNIIAGITLALIILGCLLYGLLLYITYGSELNSLNYASITIIPIGITIGLTKKLSIIFDFLLKIPRWEILYFKPSIKCINYRNISVIENPQTEYKRFGDCCLTTFGFIFLIIAHTVGDNKPNDIHITIAMVIFSSILPLIVFTQLVRFTNLRICIEYTKETRKFEWPFTQFIRFTPIIWFIPFLINNIQNIPTLETILFIGVLAIVFSGIIFLICKLSQPYFRTILEDKGINTNNESLN